MAAINLTANTTRATHNQVIHTILSPYKYHMGNTLILCLETSIATTLKEGVR